jgi:23S rRNA (pseudouridine1915-N3)-methyltransferase
MLFSLIAIGRARAGPEKTLYEHYRARLRSPLDLIELDLKKPIEPVDKRRAAEAELIIAAIPAGSVIIALDERGKQLNSRDFASLIGAWQDQGERHISLIIGGADGLDQTIRNQSRIVLSYGAATWPHMLVRAMVTEQLYRAQTILDGHPYHRD